MAAEGDLDIKRGKCVIELVGRGANKGSARCGRFMECAPFAGATPVFVGDDITDEDGFRAACDLGGFGVLVGEREPTLRKIRPCKPCCSAPLVGTVNAHKSDLDLWPIGNCQVSGLIDKRGGIVWGCVPRVDGDPVFCALLNGDRQDVGVWRFELEGQVSATPGIYPQHADPADPARSRRRQRGRNPRFLPAVRAVGPDVSPGRLRPDRAPGRGQSAHQGRRSSRCANYGAALAETTNGTNHIRYLVGGQALRLSTDAPVGYILEEPDLPGRGATCISSSARTSPSSAICASEVRRMEQSTRNYWQHWVRGLATPFEWQDEVIRCAITLKLCQHEETGAIVAALTTSIPEAPAFGAQLGLSLLLDPRFLLHGAGAEPAWRAGRAGEVSRLPAQHRRRREGRADPAALFGDGRWPSWTRPPPAGSPAIAAWGRCAWAMPPTSRSSTIAMARSCCRPCRASSTSACCAWRTSAISTAWNRWARWPGRCTTSPMPACGNSARGRRCTPIPR